MKDKDIDFLINEIEIYMAMGNKAKVDEILNSLPEEQRGLVARSAGVAFLMDSMKYRL